MSDIVERLETFSDAHSWAVRGDAADEIKRLRAENQKLRDLIAQAVDDMSVGGLCVCQQTKNELVAVLTPSPP